MGICSSIDVAVAHERSMFGAYRYALSIFGAFSIPSVAVVAKLEEIACAHGYPKCLRVDNGPEHIATALERWADEHGVEVLFVEPGKPTQNAFSVLE